MLIVPHYPNAMLAQWLRSPKASVRMATIRLIARERPEALASYLGLRVRRGSPTERKAALDALVRLMNPYRRATGPWANQAEEVLNGLGKVAFPHLRGALVHPESAIRYRAAANYRAQFSDPARRDPIAIPILRRAVEREGNGIGLEAATALMIAQDPWLAAPMRRWLVLPASPNRVDFGRQSTAAQYYASHPDPGVISELLVIPPSFPQSFVVQALARLRDPRVEAALVAVLEGQREDEVPSFPAILGLERQNTPTAREALRKVTQRSPRFAVLALRSLARLGEAPEAEQVVGLFYESRASVEPEALEEIALASDSAAFAAAAERRLRTSTGYATTPSDTMLLKALAIRKAPETDAALARLREDGPEIVRELARYRARTLESVIERPVPRPPAGVEPPTPGETTRDVLETVRRLREELDGTPEAAARAWRPYLDALAREVQKDGLDPARIIERGGRWRAAPWDTPRPWCVLSRRGFHLVRGDATRAVFSENLILSGGLDPILGRRERAPQVRAVVTRTKRGTRVDDITPLLSRHGQVLPIREVVADRGRLRMVSEPWALENEPASPGLRTWTVTLKRVAERWQVESWSVR